MSEHVKRARSPNYPAISLREAALQLRQLFDRIQRHKAPKEAVLKGLGYGGWNGASATALSAHIKYGLLERLEKDEFKITDLGMRLMFHQSPKEYADALYEAATNPPLFAEMLIEYQNTVPHEDIIRPRLIRQGFAQGAVATVIESFRDTMEFVTANSGRHMPDAPSVTEAPPSPPSRPASAPLQAQPRHETTVEPPAKGEPFRVSFTGKGIEITAKISSPSDADDLIAAINALKLLLRPASDFLPPSNFQADIEGEEE